MESLIIFRVSLDTVKIITVLFNLFFFFNVHVNEAEVLRLTHGKRHLMGVRQYHTMKEKVCHCSVCVTVLMPELCCKRCM